MRWKLALGIGISAVFLFFAFRSVRLDELKQAFATADYRYVAPAAGLSLVSLWFRAVRWKYLTKNIKNIGLLSHLSATSIGLMANSVLPARIGEFVRAYVLGQKESISKSAAFATIVVERIFDGMTVLMFFVLVLVRYSYRYPEWLHNIVYFVAAFYFLAIGFIIFLRLRTGIVLKCIAFVLKPFPLTLQSALKRWLQSFIDGLGIISNIRNAIIASFYSILVWLPNALIIYILARSFEITLPFNGAFVILIIVTFGMMIPSGPAFVGTIQYCSIAGLSLFGVAKATALSFSVVYHVSAFVPITAVGLLFLFIEGYSLMDLRDSAARKYIE